jgi:hypothetical protein
MSPSHKAYPLQLSRWKKRPFHLDGALQWLGEESRCHDRRRSGSLPPHGGKARGSMKASFDLPQCYWGRLRSRARCRRAHAGSRGHRKWPQRPARPIFRFRTSGRLRDRRACQSRALSRDPHARPSKTMISSAFVCREQWLSFGARDWEIWQPKGFGCILAIRSCRHALQIEAATREKLLHGRVRPSPIAWRSSGLRPPLRRQV